MNNTSTKEKKKIVIKKKIKRVLTEKDKIKIMDKIARQHQKNKRRTVTSLDPLNLSD
jgi:hypothetical protein